jgi:hypothetical protein
VLILESDFKFLAIVTMRQRAPGNLHYDLPQTLKGRKKEKQDRPE